MEESQKPQDIGGYISRFPTEVQAILEDEPMPCDLIERIVQLRVRQNVEKAAAKRQKRK